MIEGITSNTLKTALKKVHEKNIDTGKSSEPSEEEKKGLNKCISHITADILKKTKPYGDLLEKYLSIPDYIILPENKEHDALKYHPVSEADMINSKIQSQMLEAEVTEVSYLITRLT